MCNCAAHCKPVEKHNGVDVHCEAPAGPGNLRGKVTNNLSPRSSVPTGACLSLSHLRKLPRERKQRCAQVSTIEWPQVTDDLIKVGLPAICTATVAVFASICTAAVALPGFRFTRSQELEKERRRRRQDALEKISEDFQTACVTLSDLAMNYSVYRESGGMNLEELLKTGEAIDAATKDLHRMRGRLILLQLKKCEEAFGAFLDQTIAFRKIMKLPPEPMATVDDVNREFGKVQTLRLTVERLLGEAFNSL